MKKVLLLGGLALLLGLSSCNTSRKLTYLRDMEVLKDYPVKEEAEIRIQTKDKLDIVVTCKNPELALPFNIMGGVVRTDANGEMTGLSGVSEEKKGYVVDKNGYIEFPVLGQLKVAGMTLDELKEMIANEIKAKNYIKEPIVMADFMNFQITMLGEVSSKGNFTVENNEINLLQAIAMAGDLTTNANRDEVWVIRTENGKRKVYPVNMRSVEMYDSPAFQLQQNDVVYAKPNKVKSDGAFERKTTLLSLFTSLLSTAAMLYYWVFK
ncbi:MAG: polysaccharide biosynthesis/export family protein [Bacteroidaceae bacterium]|nr:polysaccharide biosynthesis/export family protein [Bacteroidaceae bacterium]